MPWDIFLSHATEDKADVAEPLKRALERAGFSVWIDSDAIGVGESMLRAMERGLSMSHAGVVVVSPEFLSKYWTRKELDGLFMREADGKAVILPVYHRVTPETVRAQHPILGSRQGLFWSAGIDKVVAGIAAEIGGTNTTVPALPPSPAVSSPGPRADVILILPPSQKTYFVESEKVEVSDEVRLELQPDAAVSEALVADLRNGTGLTAIAFGLRVITGTVKSVSESFVGGAHRCTIILRGSDTRLGDSFLSEMAFNNLSADQIAELRARRILLNSPLREKSSGGVDPFLEVIVRGMGVPLPVTASPLPYLFRDFESDPKAFIIAARLVACLWLRLSGVVKEILKLDLALEAPGKLRVQFEGRRPRRFANVEPPLVRIEGVCDLQSNSEKPT